MELDDEFNNTKYEGETLYILHYPNGELSVSFGTLKAIYVKDNEKRNFQHLCCTEKGSSGGAVMKKDNKLNKLLIWLADTVTSSLVPDAKTNDEFDLRFEFCFKLA